MKVFISWSGDHSKQLGAAIKKWLPRVLQFVEVYFSDTDIEIGARWYNEIIDALEKSDAGLIILTPENITRQWIMFEAGALARGVSKDRVCPILFGIKKSDLRGPLAVRQNAECTEDDFRKLLKTINNGKLSEADFNDVFDTWWPKLKQSIDEIAAAPQPVLKEPSPNELLQEVLGLTRSLVIEHQKLIQVLNQGGLTDVATVVRVLRGETGHYRLRVPGPQDTAAIAGLVDRPADGLTAKSE